MKRLHELFAFALLVIAGPVAAGQSCEQRPVTPHALATAADSALHVRDALDEVDAPVALVARVGTDLRRYGLVYSHVAFVVRDHPAGRWTVVHLLNRCGTDRSALYAQGLVNYFADDLVTQDAAVVWLESDEAQRLARFLASDGIHALHATRYSVIARPDSERFQNSTAWVLEALAAARLGGSVDRSRAQAMALAEGHVPDLINIPYGKRIAGGLFAANASFSDHPVGTRLSGRYPVVTVRSIFRYLRTLGVIEHQREWRGGVMQEDRRSAAGSPP